MSDSLCWVGVCTQAARRVRGVGGAADRSEVGYMLLCRGIALVAQQPELLAQTVLRRLNTTAAVIRVIRGVPTSRYSSRGTGAFLDQKASEHLPAVSAFKAKRHRSR